MNETKFEIVNIYSTGLNDKDINTIKKLVQNMEEKNEFPPENLGLSWVRSPDVSDSKKHSISGVDKHCKITTKRGYYIFFNNQYQKPYEELVEKYNDLIDHEIERKKAFMRARRG